MLPSTAIGLLIVSLAILPGAVYTWSFERRAGAFSVNFTDPVLRFLGVSAVVQLVAAWPEYLVYRTLRSAWPNVAPGEFARAWLLFLLIVVIPAIAGSVAGSYSRKPTEAGRLSRLLSRPERVPRAWDYLFMSRPSVYVRVRTTGDEWIAGRFARKSYAGGFPNDTDLFLEESYAIDNEGTIEGRPLGYSTYIPADKIAWLEILPEGS